VGELEHLDHCCAGEDLHHGAGRRLDFRDCLAHLNAGDAFDLSPQRFSRVGEQLPVKILHFGGARGQGPLGRRQRFVQCDHKRVLAEHHRDRLGHVTRPLLLKIAGSLGNLLGHR